MGNEKSGLKQNTLEQKVDWTITPRIRELAEQYMHLHGVTTVNAETLFHSTIFSLLAARQDYPNHVRIYATLLANGYGNPEKILADKNKLQYHRCLASASGPNQKRERLVNLAEWWLGSDLPKRVIEDATNGQKQEFTLRNLFSDEAPGVANKGASMLWGHIGYRNVVPIDTWMIRYLRERGHLQFKQSDNVTVGGYRRDVYLDAEKIMSKYAEEQDVKPYLFQVMLWIAATGWTPARYIDPKTLNLTAQKTLWDAETLETTMTDSSSPAPVLRRWKGNKMTPPGGSTIQESDGPTLF